MFATACDSATPEVAALPIYLAPRHSSRAACERFRPRTASGGDLVDGQPSMNTGHDAARYSQRAIDAFPPLQIAENHDLQVHVEIGGVRSRGSSPRARPRPSNAAQTLYLRRWRSRLTGHVLDESRRAGMMPPLAHVLNEQIEGRQRQQRKERRCNETADHHHGERPLDLGAVHPED